MMKFILVALFVILPFSADVRAETEVAAGKLAEDQIPLTIDTAKKTAETGGTSTKALASMFIIVVMAGAGIFFVRKYKLSNSINKSNTKIQVLSQHYLGPKKSLAIIHVAGESILVGITDHNISMIKSLSLIDDEVPADLPNTFGQTLEKTEQKVQAAPVTAKPAVDLDEEFSFSNVTENVSKKLKSMRSFS